MDPDRLNRWITLAANLGVLVGVFLLIVELRQNTESIELQAAQSYVALSHELDFRIVDDPSLITLFLTPPDERTPEETRRLDRWYFGSLRTWENGFFLHSKGVLDEDLWSGQEEFMADLLRDSDELRDYYQANRSYFSKSFVAFLDDLLEEESE
jgi:hypothetical protein